MPFVPLEIQPTEELRTSTPSFVPVERQPEPIRTGFFQGVGEDIKARGEQFTRTLQKLDEGEQGLGSSTLQLTGQTFGGVFDVIGRGLTSVGRGVATVVPGDAIGDFFKSVGKKALDTESGKILMDNLEEFAGQYSKFKGENPVAAANLEAAGNIGAFLTLASGKGVQAAKKGVIGEVGLALERSGVQKAGVQRKDFIRNLIRPKQTLKIKELQVPRTTERGFGPFKKSDIKPTAQEAAAEKAVIDIKTVKPGNTNQKNYNIIRDELTTQAETLKSELIANDFNYPRRELLSRLNAAKANLAKNPTIVGDAEKTADKLIDEIIRRVENAPAKGSELLQIRKDFDFWVKEQKGAGIFDPARENAFSIANREIRQTLNTFLDEKAVSVEVKQSLANQNALYNALGNVAPKAAIEADTAFIRGLTKIGEILGTKSRIVQGIAAAVGIGGLGAAATFATPVVVAGGTGFLIYRTGKLILSPQVRKLLGQALKEFDNVKLGGEVNAAGIAAAKELVQELLEKYGGDEEFSQRSLSTSPQREL